MCAQLGIFVFLFLCHLKGTFDFFFIIQVTYQKLLKVSKKKKKMLNLLLGAFGRKSC